MKQIFSNCGGRVLAHMDAAEMYEEGGEASALASSQSIHNNGGIANITSIGPSSLACKASSTKPNRVLSCIVRSCSMRQQELDKAYQLNKRKKLDEKWASFFYEANVSFNVGRHHAFVAAMNATASAGFNYKPPLYNALRTPLIRSKKLEVEAEVKKVTSFSIETYGVSLCSDGWDNVVHHPLMNVMLYCLVDDIFVGSMDTSVNKRTKEYIVGKLKRYIKEIGPI